MEYKDTLNLPTTDFPMKANLPQKETEILAAWEETGLYARIEAAGKGNQLDRVDDLLAHAAAEFELVQTDLERLTSAERAKPA